MLEPIIVHTGPSLSQPEDTCSRNLIPRPVIPLDQAMKVAPMVTSHVFYRELPQNATRSDTR